MLMSSKRRVFGITLIELMVVLAVMALIATIGYPLYTQQVLKSRRGDARAGVMEIALAQEREFAAWGQYSELAGPITTDGQVDISFDDNLPLANVNSNINDDLNRIAREYGTFYTFAVTTTNTTFSVTATPVLGQAEDSSCFGFTRDQTGAKTAQDKGGVDQTNLCW
jgi:type IV pilus assembly protein PilE